LKCPVEITNAYLVYDRSRSTTDWNCPRQRYLNYELDGTGVVPEDEQVELFTGSVNHDALSAIALGTLQGSVNIDAIAQAAADKILQFHSRGTPTDAQTLYAKEQASLTYGMLKGFYQHVWPRLMEMYDIVAVEEEMFFVHDQYGKSNIKDGKFIMMCKPDLVLRSKATKELVYYEYKTTSSKKEGWVSQWEDSVQVHSTINAIHQSLGERPTCVIIQGLYKGYESYGKQSSPFCYAYRQQGHPPFSKEIISYEYRNGLRRVPTWELEGGTKKWVEEMPENVLADQYPQTPPIFPNDDLITDFFMQRAMRELEIKMAKQMLEGGVDEKMVLNGAFPQRFDRCKAPYGVDRKPCAFRSVCHGSCDPLKSGYVRREPHHELEIAQNEVQKTSTIPGETEATSAL
jgi:hypothetical protein